jgi:hypothetical protein
MRPGKLGTPSTGNGALPGDSVSRNEPNTSPRVPVSRRHACGELHNLPAHLEVIMSLRDRLKRVRAGVFAAKLEYGNTLSPRAAWRLERLARAERHLERLIAAAGRRGLAA